MWNIGFTRVPAKSDNVLCVVAAIEIDPDSDTLAVRITNKRKAFVREVGSADDNTYADGFFLYAMASTGVIYNS